MIHSLLSIKKKILFIKFIYLTDRIQYDPVGNYKGKKLL